MYDQRGGSRGSGYDAAMTDHQFAYLTSARGGLMFTRRDLRGLSSFAQLKDDCTSVRQRLAAGEAPVHLPLDIDCLDPALAKRARSGKYAVLDLQDLSRGHVDQDRVGADAHPLEA